MIQGSARDDLLSEDEVRELLDEEEPVVAPPPLPVGQESAGRVLLVARRGTDARLIGSRLQAAGAAVDHVRNPFAALDRLRLEPHGAVVSELDLWADEGSLLLDRLRRTGRPLPVLFLSDARGDQRGTAARVCRAGAWDVIFRPLDAAEVEGAVQGLLRAVQVASAGGGTAEPPSQSDPSAGPSAAEIPRQAGDSWTPPPGRSDSRSIPDAHDAAPSAELAWLRFYFLASEALRAPVPPEERIGRLVEAARAAVGPRAVGAFLESDEHFVLRIEAGPRVEASTLEFLAGLGSNAGEIPESDALLVLGLGPTSTRNRLILFGLRAPVRAAAQPFLPALRSLLESAFRPR